MSEEINTNGSPLQNETQKESTSEVVAGSRGKRQCGRELRKEVDPDEGLETDPGTWKADPSVLQARRKVHVRRANKPAESQQPEAIASNPFAGISLFGASNAAATTNPFASVKLTVESDSTDITKPATEAAEALMLEQNEENKSSEKGEEKDDKDLEKPSVASSIFGAAFSSGGFASVLGSSSFGNGFKGFASSTPAFTFGSFGSTSSGVPAANPIFAFSAGEGAEAEDPEAPSTASFKPVVQLPEVAKVTGEEEEQTRFAEKGKLFEFDRAASQWRERGVGEFRVNSRAAAGDAAAAHRMLMRQDGGLRVLVNAKVFPGISLSLMEGKKGVTFACVNSAGSGGAASAAEKEKADDAAAEDKGGKEGGASASPALTTWAIRFKSVERAEACLSVLKSLSTRPAPEASAV